ncbi:MAG: sarcosine oxidase subunit gamma family protein [Candidatus Rariloculaceae bacterium]
MIYDVDIAKLELSCVLNIQGAPADVVSLLSSRGISLPEKPNTAALARGMAIYWVGPTQWILRAPEALEEQLLQELQSDPSNGNTSVVDISDTLQFFSVTGRDADDVLSVCCPLDIHRTVFPANAVTYTEIVSTKALLLRIPDGYEFAVDRSYADFANDSMHRILGTTQPVNHAGRPSPQIS